MLEVVLPMRKRLLPRLLLAFGFAIAACGLNASGKEPAVELSQGPAPSAYALDVGLNPDRYERPVLSESAGSANALLQNPPAAEMNEGAGAAADGAGGGGDNGTNPAHNATTFIMSNEFYRLLGGVNINTSYARFKFPILDKRSSVLLEIPFKFYDLDALNPALPQIGGLGDVKFQISYNYWQSENKRLTAISFLEAYVPSADNVLLTNLPNVNQFVALDLGSGKYVLGPGLGFVYMIRPNMLFAPLYFYEASVAGESDRPRINRGKWRVFGMYALKNGLYALPEFQAVTNYFTGNTDYYFAPEVGFSRKGTTFYVKPGIGIAPDANDRQWGLEFGVRVMF
jgi:hypothetical protein